MSGFAPRGRLVNEAADLLVVGLDRQARRRARPRIRKLMLGVLHAAEAGETHLAGRPIHSICLVPGAKDG